MEDAAGSLRVELLGPLRLVVDGMAVDDVRGPMRRAVFALLALAESRTVTVDHLVDALWPGAGPESARQALHTHVSRLRAQLGPAAARLQTRHGGYRLELGTEDLDVTRARRLLATARSTAGQDPTGALPLLREAHALWRGPVLADLTDVAPVAAAVTGCGQLYREVTDALIGCALDAGQLDGIVGLAVAALDADPLREPAVLLLMRALAATGRATEALRTGREYRHQLADEAGLDPSPALGELERDIAGGVVGQGPATARSAAPAPPTTRMLGRGAHVAALHRLLAAQRLVTLVGPGGVGKTRVALEVAREAETGTRLGPASGPSGATLGPASGPSGATLGPASGPSGATLGPASGPSVTVLPLAPVTDPASLPHALATALTLRVARGDVLAACLAVLDDGPRLLVIDNCEHLLDAARDLVAEVLAGCPQLTVLATSREPLGLAAEYVSRLAPLRLPDPHLDPHPDQDQPVREPGTDLLARVPSVAMFLDRAARVRPGAPPTGADLRLVAGIVRRLDGMPLAIELAAGRLSTFSLTDLNERLDRALDLLGGGRSGADARHRSLRATVEWSYQLLTADERRLFRHLSVFVDGVALPAAEQLAAGLGLAGDPGSVLARLVDASMVDAVFEGSTRYRMLETLRAFGLDRLAAEGDHDEAHAGLLNWAVELTTRIDHDMGTDREPDADRLLRRELPNLRAAWRLARGRGATDVAATMITALFDAITYRDLVEIRDWAEELAHDPALADHPRAAAVLGTAAEAVYHRGDYPRAERLARTGLRRATGTPGSWYCLLPLSVAELARGAYAEVVEHSLAAAAIAPRPRESLGIAALATAYAGDLDRARTLNERGLATAASPTMRAWGAYVAGEIDNAAGRQKSAVEHYLRAVDLARCSGATFLVGVATVGLLTVRAAAGQVHDALRGYRDVIDYFARTGNWTHLWVTLRNLADLLRRLGDEQPAAVLDAAADRAPDAPAVGPFTGEAPRAGPAPPGPGRAGVLEVARRAIERNLTGS